jgi:hypothetical protein
MSDQENFLTRWSRRKREDAEAGAPEAVAPDAPKTQPSGAPETVPAVERPTEPDEPLFDLKSLPAIETITAETDIRAFLLPGVPADLKRAALRRAWAADPAIRDFIGLSENSWDFNDPGAMGGFGPLEMTEDLRRLVQQLFTEPPQEPSPDDKAKDQAAAALEQPSNLPPATSTQEEVATITQQFPQRDESSQGNGVVAGEQEPVEEPVDLQTTSRRYHGGALPE